MDYALYVLTVDFFIVLSITYRDKLAHCLRLHVLYHYRPVHTSQTGCFICIKYILFGYIYRNAYYHQYLKPPTMIV